MAQFVRPSADLDNTGVWTTEPLWSKIDDAGDAGADSVFAVSDATPAITEPFSVDGSTVTDPAVSTGHIIRARWSKTGTGTNTRGVCQLRQGYASEASQGTLIATLTGAALAEVLTTQTHTLTSGEADAITDYADLQFRVYAEKVAGGTAHSWQVEYVELEVPDAAGGDDTATPATVGVVAGIPAVTVTASAEKAATTVGAPAAVPAATVTASVEKSATAVDVPSAVPQPTVTASVEKEATTVSAPAAVPLPTVTGSGDATATPAAVDAPAAVPQATPTASVEKAAASVDVVAAVPQATVTASAEKAVAAVAAVTGIPAASLTASVDFAAATVNIITDIPLVTILSGVALDITALGLAQFHRINGVLVLSPIGRSIRHGFSLAEGFERASDTFRIDNHRDGEATRDEAMVAVAAAWAANSGAAIATLKTAIHTALEAAGFRAQDGSSLS